MYNNKLEVMLWNIILFIIIIIIFHILWNYLKDTFTMKKKKYINIEAEKYRQIMEEYSFSKLNLPSTPAPETESLDLIEQDLELFLQNNI